MAVSRSIVGSTASAVPGGRRSATADAHRSSAAASTTCCRIGSVQCCQPRPVYPRMTAAMAACWLLLRASLRKPPPVTRETGSVGRSTPLLPRRWSLYIKMELWILWWAMVNVRRICVSGFQHQLTRARRKRSGYHLFSVHLRTAEVHHICKYRSHQWPSISFAACFERFYSAWSCVCGSSSENNGPHSGIRNEGRARRRNAILVRMLGRKRIGASRYSDDARTVAALRNFPFHPRAPAPLRGAFFANIVNGDAVLETSSSSATSRALLRHRAGRPPCRRFIIQVYLVCVARRPWLS